MFFQWYERDFFFEQALAEELRHHHHLSLHGGAYPQTLIETAERAIAHDLIAVGTELPGGVTLRFEKDQPSGRHMMQRVWFSGEAAAERFLVEALRTSGNQEACSAALQHPQAGVFGSGTSAPSPQRVGGASAPADDEAALGARVAPLLLSQRLELIATDQARRTLRLTWVEHGPPVGVAVRSAAPPPPRRSAPPPPPPPAPLASAPASALPDPPPYLSPASADFGHGSEARGALLRGMCAPGRGVGRCLTSLPR